MVCDGKPLSIGGIRVQKQDREILFNKFNNKFSISLLVSRGDKSNRVRWHTDGYGTKTSCAVLKTVEKTSRVRTT